MIEVRNLVKRYGDHLAVDHVSFTIEEGRIYGFLGPNGAGKSTTMNIMTGYIGPTSGDVIINGHSILEEPEEAKKYIGYLPELPPVYMDMTVKEYLAFCAELKGIPKEERAKEIRKSVKRTKIDDVYERMIGNLSKGYRQRVGLAQAILGSPATIILDEPTVGLDPKQIIEIRDLIRELSKDHTVILSSHILSEVQEVCDQIIIIHHGKMLANGTTAELEASLGSSTIDLTVKAESEDEVRAMLANVEGIMGIKSRPNQRGEISVTLKLRRGSDVREAVFNAAVKSGHTLLKLNQSEMNLENIFLEITKGGTKKKGAKSKDNTEV